MNTDPDPQSSGDAPDDFERRLALQTWRPIPAPWRREILGDRNPAPTGWIAIREFLWPAPWAWGAVAAAWLLVAGFFTAAEWTAKTGATLAGRETQPRGNPLHDWQHRQALLSALLEETPPLERRPTALPRPRSGLPGPRFGRLPFPTSFPLPA